MTLRPDALRARLDKLAEVFAKLQRLREIPAAERDPWTVERGLQFQGLGGFRNILVHAYLDLDPDLVEQHLQKAPEAFALFRRAIDEWLSRQEGT